jgi:hypothetical protein
MSSFFYVLVCLFGVNVVPLVLVVFSFYVFIVFGLHTLTSFLLARCGFPAPEMVAGGQELISLTQKTS